MKKIISLIMAITIGSTMVIAGNTQSVEETISKQLRVQAGILNQNDERVTIDFKMKPNGQVLLVAVNTANRELKKEVTEQFPEIDFSNAEKLSEGNYSINILFRVM